MKASLVLNENNEIALFYGEHLGFTPEWASIDVEQEELYIGAGEENEENGKHIQLDEIKQEIYEQIQPDRQILLVRLTDGDFNRPEEALWVPLMIAQQLL